MYVYLKEIVSRLLKLFLGKLFNRLENVTKFLKCGNRILISSTYDLGENPQMLRISLLQILPSQHTFL